MDIVEAEGRRIAQRQYERFARGELRAQDSGGLGSPSLLCVSTQVHPPMLNLRSLLASRGSPRGRSARSGSTAGSPEAEGSSAEGASAVEREREAPHGAAKLRTNVDAGLESALPWSESFVLEGVRPLTASGGLAAAGGGSVPDAHGVPDRPDTAPHANPRGGGAGQGHIVRSGDVAALFPAGAKVPPPSFSSPRRGKASRGATAGGSTAGRRQGATPVGWWGKEERGQVRHGLKRV